MEKKILDEIKALDLRGLRNRGMKVVAQMEDFRNKRSGADQTLTADQEAEYDRWDEECVAIEKEIRFQERKESFNGEEARSPRGTTVDTTEEKYDPKFNPDQRTINRTRKKMVSRGFQGLNTEEKRILALIEREERAFEDALIVKFDPDKMDDETRSVFKNMEKRAQTTQTTTTGGYFIPQGFIDQVIMYMKYISPFFEEFKPTPSAAAQSLFDFRRTTSGNDVPWPSMDDTTNTGELLAENTTIGSATDLTISRIVLKAYKYSSKPILVPYELFEDSAIDIPALIGEAIGSRIGRVVNPHFTTGDNSSKPQGIITGATSGKVSAATTATTFPEILDLIHSVDPSYRKRPTCRFMLHDNILLYLKKLTVGAATTNARPLWAPGWDTASPPTIDGFQYTVNQDMASAMTTGSKIILFGDMKSYAIRMVNDVRAYRLEERYRDLDQTGFVSFIRMDGRVKNTAALKYLRLT